MAANSADFLGGGSDLASPFSSVGVLPIDPAQQDQNQRDANQFVNQQTDAKTAASNSPFYAQQSGSAYNNPNYFNPDGTRMTPEQLAAAQDAYMQANHLGKYAHSFAHNLVRDPITMGVLAAPLAVTGAGAALGGLGAGSAIGGGVGAGGVTSSGAVAGSPEAAAFADTGIGALGTTGAATDAASVAAGQAAGAGTASGLASAAAPAVAKAAPSFLQGLAGDALKTGLGLAGGLAINALTKPGTSDADKQLIAAQQKIADEAAAQRDAGAQATYDGLAQRMLAYMPFNNLVAQLIGPQNAITSGQAAGLVQNPNAPADPYNVANYSGNDATKLQEQQDYLHRLRAYQQAEAQRQQTISQFQTPGQYTPPANAGMPAPLPAQRYF